MGAFFISLFLNLVVALLAPKPKLPNAKRYSLNEFEFPTATEDRSQQYGVGVFQANGNVIWADDYYAHAITEEVSTGPFSSQTVTKGHRYHVGMWFTLTGVTCDEVHEIRLGDHLVWSGKLVLSKTVPTTLDVDAQWNTSEDQEIADGMFGRFVFFNRAIKEGTDYVPASNAYLEQQLGVGNVPEYPNTLHVLWVGPSAGIMPLPAGASEGPALFRSARAEYRRFGFIGTSHQVPALTFTLNRKPEVSVAFPAGRDITYPVVGNTNDAAVRAAVDAFIANNSDVEGDANPGFLELELLTSRMPGLGPRISPWAVEVETFLKKAERLKQEKHGISMPWEASQAMSEVLDDIGQQTNGFIELNERTGQLKAKLLRQDDAPVVVFDDDNIVEIISFTRTMADRAPNLIEVPFIDRANGWTERLAHAKNAAGQKAAGTTITSRAEYRGVTTERLAAILASREMRKLSSPLAKASWTGTVPVGTVLKPGDLVTFKHTRLNQTLRMRIVSARFANFENRLRVEIEALEDVFRNGLASFATGVTPLPGQVAAVPPTSLVNGQALLAPYALTGDEADHLLYIGDDSGTATNTYRLALQKFFGWSETEPYVFADGEQEPAITGTLTMAAASTAVSPTVTMTLSAAAVEQWSRRPRGQVYLIAGEEWIAASQWTLNGTTLSANLVTRGIYDTVPQPLTVGMTVRILLGYVVFPQRLKTALGTSLPTYDGMDAATVRAESRGNGGILPPDGAVASEARWQFASDKSRGPRPLPPGNVTLAGVRGTLSETETPPVVGRGTYTVQWTNRNRLTRDLAGYFNAAGDAEPNVRVAVRLEQKGDGNADWYGDSWQTLAAGATTTTVNTANVQAGARRIRLRILSERVYSGGRSVVSKETFVYFQLTS